MDKPCHLCGYPGPHEVTLRTDGKHYADRHCGSCGRHIGFVPKPEGDKARRPSAHRKLVQRFGRGFCELCLAKEAELPKGETLEGHHVEEYKNDGEPTKDNTWILCTACHALVNWRRTYQAHMLAQRIADRFGRWKEPE